MSEKPAVEKSEPGLIAKLQRHPTVNPLNKRVLEALTEFPPEQTGEWTSFVTLTQNYRSPSTVREHTLVQDGLFQLPPNIKYVRSELNTNAFGEEYDKHKVLIRESSSDSFIHLAAGYVTHTPGHGVTSWSPQSPLSLKQFLDLPDQHSNLVSIAPDPNQTEAVCQQLGEALGPDYPGAVYLCLKEPLSEQLRSRLEEVVSDSQAQILIEEPYDPFNHNDSKMRAVSFLHNGDDWSRYQLLQDAASMGFRPRLEECLHYHFEAGRFEPPTRTGGIELPVQPGHPTGTRLVGAGLDRCRQLLTEIKAQDPVDRAVRKAALESLAQRSGDFEKDYDLLRTSLQYWARLDEKERPQSPDHFEMRLADREGGQTLSTQSGMTATRQVLTTLGPRVDKIWSTTHYWETDFLIENCYSHNPHYPQPEQTPVGKVTMVDDFSSADQVAKVVDEVVATNPDCPGGQLLAFDRSIHNCFHTRTFELFAAAQRLAERAEELENPVYLVVDNTLDFDVVRGDTLFPDGVPENVVLVFTTSQAKLHQMGMDMVTGGHINLHHHPGQNDLAGGLMNEFRQGLEGEQGRQDSYSLRLLDQLYTQSDRSDYLDYMVGQRQRNTGALAKGMEESLGEGWVKTAEGRLQFQDEAGQPRTVTMKNPDDPTIEHRFEMNFHHAPDSGLHAFLQVMEGPGNSVYIAGSVFAEVKRRVYEQMEEAGMPLADGTSWGFTKTRIDQYMHTARICTGLETDEQHSRLGQALGRVLNQMVEDPDRFIRGIEFKPLEDGSLVEKGDQILALDSLIPGSDSTLSTYAEPLEQGQSFSQLVEQKGEVKGVVLAYQRDDHAYISKAATAPESRGQGLFRTSLEAIKAEAREAGLEKVVLETSASESNHGVVRAYEKCGFEVVGTRTVPLDNGWPLILAVMESSTEPGAREVQPSQPVPAAVYERYHRNSQKS